MPTWLLRDTETNEEFQEFFTSYSRMEEHLETNPHIVRTYRDAPAIVSGVGMSGPKTDDGFKEVLGRIKKGAPGNTIRD